VRGHFGASKSVPPRGLPWVMPKPTVRSKERVRHKQREPSIVREQRPMKGVPDNVSCYELLRVDSLATPVLLGIFLGPGIRRSGALRKLP
jgi:hypothetical protein